MEFSESLKKNEDFRNVYRNGVSRANRQLILYQIANGTERNRLGISVSKKVGNSVVRHRMARLIRESYRLNESDFSRGYDIVVVVRSSAVKLDYFGMEKSLIHLAKLHNIYRK
ncbi:MAG: ribonuclease P protein component [Clostridiales bacterium]|nr:ribonuclease P protein component [Clostridiales bacterium]